MNRSSIGNIITNGQQILSVGATTAGKFLRGKGDASKTLNNKNEEPMPKLPTGNNTTYVEGEVSYPEPNQKQIEQNINTNPRNIDLNEDQYNFEDEEEENANTAIGFLEQNNLSGQSQELSRYERNNFDWIKTYRNLKNVGLDLWTKKFKGTKNIGGNDNANV